MATQPSSHRNLSAQHVRARGHQRQRGVGLLEFSIIVPLLISLVAFPFFFGRAFMYYSVGQKAAQNAALYLATVPRSEMQEVFKSQAAAAMAHDIVNATMKEADLGVNTGITYQVQCNNSACGSGVIPTSVGVKIMIPLYDVYFPFLTWVFLGDGPFLMNADVTVPYLGK